MLVQWGTLAEASADIEGLLKPETLQILINVLRSFVSACTSLGEYFWSQLGGMYLDMIGLYRALGSLIVDIMANEGQSRSADVISLLVLSSDTGANHIKHTATTPTLTRCVPVGDIAAKTPKVRYARTIKREILKLVETYVKSTNNPDIVEFTSMHLVPPFFDAVVTDYGRNPPATRESEVLVALDVVTMRLSVGLYLPWNVCFVS